MMVFVAERQMPNGYNVLVVCSANVCRSPMIERLFRQRLQARLGADASRFDVRSAGAWEFAHRDMHPHAAAGLREYDADADAFTPRALELRMVTDADLVLTATREHRGIVTGFPGRPTAFTLLQFARLLTPVDPSAIRGTDVVRRAHEVVDAALDNRGLVTAQRPED